MTACACSPVSELQAQPHHQQWRCSLDNKPLLSVKGIYKNFPGVRALSDVSIDFFGGEVHILLGENGAGKSTLVKIIAGVYKKDAGEILYDGEPIEIQNVRDAQSKGISIIHQELNLLKYKSISENIFLGREPIKNKLLRLVDKKKMSTEAVSLLKSLGIVMDPKLIINQLGVAQQQMVEVAKALAFKSRILILDEPTATLTNNEIEKLFSIIRNLKSEGVCIIYISHRLEEIKQIGDRITVMRDGKKIGTMPVSEVDIDQLIAMMVGREIKQLYNRHYNRTDQEALRVENLTSSRFKDINLHVNYGEIVGLSGLVGAGRTELVKAIFGYDKVKSGEIYVDGQRYSKPSTFKSFGKGLALIPEDRKNEGLFLDLDVKSNIVASSLRKLFPGRVMNRKIESRTAEQYVKDLRIMTPSINKLTIFLSGGNQQKIVLAKCLCTDAKIFIFDEPTRGIDVGAKAEIYTLIDSLVKEGKAVLMISSELPEIIGICDRVYVMAEGKISGMVDRANLDQVSLLKLSFNR